MVTHSREQWESIRRGGWLRYVLFPYSIVGLLTGFAVLMINGLILPPPNFDLLGRLAFSIPFFIAG